MAKIKICLDAGHYGKTNRSPAVPAYYESDMNWNLHLKLKAALEEYGVEVITTRANQATDLGLKDRGKKAKGCNLFLSIHSNAVDGNVHEGTDYPLAIVPINGTGDAIGKKLANCIRDTMGTTQAADMWAKKSDKGNWDWYGVIYGAVSVGVPGIILEHSFHTDTRSTNWLLNDANLDKLAKAEAEVIAAHYGLSNPTKTESRTEYTVQAVRKFGAKAEADTAVAALRADGYDVSVKAVTVEVEKPQAPAPVKPKKSLDEIARAVINGDYGNGHATREANLRAAGLLEHYTYQQIRARVNELCR